MKNLLLFCLVLIFSSCSLFSKKAEIDYSESYITGAGTENIPSEDIRKNLSRSTTMAGGNYILEAFPVSTAYINSYSKEVSAGRNFTALQSKKLQKVVGWSHLMALSYPTHLVKKEKYFNNIPASGVPKILI